MPKSPTSPPSQHPKAVGDRSEAFALAVLVDNFETVLLPWGENQRYDFVVEDAQGDLQKVQVKTGRLRNGAVIFNAFSTTYHHPNNGGRQHYVHGYGGEIDAFLVWCPDLNEAYWVPSNEVGQRQVALRVDPPRNNQRARIRFAADYRIHPPE